MENQIPVQDWALPGEPFRLAAVATDAADWAALLPATAQARMARFTEAAGRNQAGASEWLKTCWLPRELGLERVEFTTGPNGKPLLAGAAADWDFNLSHARTHAVAVLARGGAVGVDLESLARQADIARLGERVLSDSEKVLVQGGGREAFFTLWSQKEALLKALGCGWADGSIVRRTRLEPVPLQVEPATGVKIWSRRVLGGSHALAVALK